MLKGAIAGLGNIAVRGHVPAYNTDDWLKSHVAVTAVMDVVDEARATAAEHFPGARFHSSLSSLLASESIDFIDICTPPHTHAAIIRDCAAKGIHVLCEKPLTESLATSLDVVSRVKEARIIFVPCHQYKYSPLWSAMHDVITSGGIGEVTLAQFNVFRLQADTGSAAWKPQWRTTKNLSGGGILVDTGAHYFYLTQFFFGVPSNLTAVLRTLKHREYGVEDTALVNLEYKDKIVQLNLTWAADRRANSASVIGTKGSLLYDGARLCHVTGGEMREIPMPDVSDKSQYVKWYASLFREFFRRIEENNRSDDLLQEALTVMRLLDQSYRWPGTAA
jgi:predicted dehydrogenase